MESGRGSFSTGKPMAAPLLRHFGLCALRGIFVSHYITRFVVAFLMLPYFHPPSSSSPSSSPRVEDPKKNLLTVGKGSYIALWSFINVHLQYMFLAVFKDSLPAWKSWCYRKIQPYLPSCSCCQSPSGGRLKKMIATFIRWYHKIPCQPGVFLTLFMCLLWAPLYNLGGLAVYVKVVFSCSALFLLLEDDLGGAEPATRRALGSCSVGAEFTVNTAVPPTPLNQTSMQVHSRGGSSPTLSTSSGTIEPGMRGSSHSYYSRRSPSPARRISDKPPSCTTRSSSLKPNRWWVCELLAGLGTVTVACAADITPSTSAAPGRLQLAPIVAITLVAGGCLIAGMYLSSVPLHGVECSTGEGPPASATGAAKASSALGRAEDVPADEDPTERTFLDFVKATARTCKRPSMQAASVVVCLLVFFESFFQQYFLVLLLAVAPPHAELGDRDYFYLPLWLGVSWATPLVTGNLFQHWFRTRCHYSVGSLGLVLSVGMGVLLLLIAVTGTGLIGNAQQGQESAPPSHVTTGFASLVFRLIVGWLLLFVGLTSGVRRALMKEVAPVVLKEDEVIFRRCPRPVLLDDSERLQSFAVKGGANNKPRLVEEVFALITLLSRTSAAVLGCLLFWAVPVTAFGSSPDISFLRPAHSSSDSTLTSFQIEQEWRDLHQYHRQLRLVLLPLGMWITVAFGLGLYVWRQRYKLYGYHKVFIENSIASIEKERYDLFP